MFDQRNSVIRCLLSVLKKRERAAALPMKKMGRRLIWFCSQTIFITFRRIFREMRTLNNHIYKFKFILLRLLRGIIIYSLFASK